MLSEEEIIKGCKQYNKAAQMALYKKYAGKMNAICYRYIHNYEDSKDIVQEGFIKVFSSISSYKGNGSFEGWIRRIMVNTTIDYLKRNKKHIWVPLNSEIDTDNIDESLAIPASHIEESEGIGSSEFSSEQLYWALNQLPELYKLIFNMHCLEDYSHKEISEILSIKEETSRSRLARARKILKNLLDTMAVQAKSNKIIS